MWSNFTRKSFQFSSASSRTRKKVTSDKKPQSKQKGSSNPPKSAAGERRPKKAASANPDRRQAQEPNCMTRQYSTNTSHRHVQQAPDEMIEIRQDDDDDGSETQLNTPLPQLPVSQHARRRQKISTRSQPGQMDMIESTSNTTNSSMFASSGDGGRAPIFENDDGFEVLNEIAPNSSSCHSYSIAEPPCHRRSARDQRLSQMQAHSLHQPSLQDSYSQQYGSSVLPRPVFYDQQSTSRDAFDMNQYQPLRTQQSSSFYPKQYFDSTLSQQPESYDRRNSFEEYEGSNHHLHDTQKPILSQNRIPSWGQAPQTIRCYPNVARNEDFGAKGRPMQHHQELHIEHTYNPPPCSQPSTASSNRWFSYTEADRMGPYSTAPRNGSKMNDNYTCQTDAELFQDTTNRSANKRCAKNSHQQSPKKSLIAKIATTAKSNLLRPWINTFTQTFLTRPSRLLSFSQHVPGTGDNPNEIKNTDAISGSVRSKHQELVTVDDANEDLQVSKQRRSQRDKTPSRSICRNLCERNTEAEKDVLQVHNHSKIENVGIIAPTFENFDSSDSEKDAEHQRFSSTILSTAFHLAKQYDAGLLSTPCKPKKEDGNRGSPQALEANAPFQVENTSSKKQRLDPPACSDGISEFSDTTIQALVSEHVKLYMNTSFMEMLQGIVREELLKNSEKESSPQTALQRKPLSSESSLEVGAVSTKVLECSAAITATIPNSDHLRLQDGKQLFVNSQSSGLSSLTECHGASNQRCSILQRVLKNTIYEEKGAQKFATDRKCESLKSTSANPNQTPPGQEEDCCSNRKTFHQTTKKHKSWYENDIIPETEPEVVPPMKIATNESQAARSPDQSARSEEERVPATAPPEALRSKKSAPINPNESQAARSPDHSTRSEEESVPATAPPEALYRSKKSAPINPNTNKPPEDDENISLSMSSNNHTHHKSNKKANQVTPLMNNWAHVTEVDRLTPSVKDKKYSVPASLCTSQANVKSSVIFGTKFTTSNVSPKSFTEDIIPETSLDQFPLQHQEVITPFNDDCTNKENQPSRPNLQCEGNDNDLPSRTHNYALRSGLTDQSSSTNAAKVEGTGKQRKEVARWSFGVKVQSEANNVTPCETKKVLKPSKRRRLKCTKNEQQPGCQQQIDVDDIFCFPNPGDVMQDELPTSGRLDSGRKRSFSKLEKPARSASGYKKPRLASWFGL